MTFVDWASIRFLLKEYFVFGIKRDMTMLLVEWRGLEWLGVCCARDFKYILKVSALESYVKATTLMFETVLFNDSRGFLQHLESICFSLQY